MRSAYLSKDTVFLNDSLSVAYILNHALQTPSILCWYRIHSAHPTLHGGAPRIVNASKIQASPDFLHPPRLWIQLHSSNATYKDYEIVLLGDEGSASASEVLIAGLTENLNSKFFGKKTFGKGTVQEMVTLSDGDQYKLTIKKWLTPNGNWINDTGGITPDEEVELDSKYFETFDVDDDTQLNFAIEYLSKKSWINSPN